MSEVVDIVHKLTYETNTNAIQDVNKAFATQFQEIRDLEAEQAKLNALQSSTNSIKVTEQLNQKLAENKRRIDDVTAAIGKEFAANEKLAASTVKATKNLSNLSFAGSQLLREAPAFTYSIQTGILALSNNIPVLLDQLKSARGAGGTTKEIFSALGSSIFGLSGIITIAVSALTIFGNQIFGVGEKAKAAADDYQKFVDAISQNIGSTISAIDKQSNRANILFDVIQKGGKGATGAIKELRDTYPSLFEKLTDADVLAGKGINRLKEQIATNEKAKLAENELGLFQKQKREATKELTKATEENTIAQTRLNQAQFVYNNALPEQINQARSALELAQKTANRTSIALSTAKGNVQNLSASITLAQSQAAGFISQSPDLAFKSDKAKKEKAIDPEKALLNADKDLQELQRVKASIFDKYRELVRQDLLSGTELTKEEEAGREKNLNTEIKIIDNFIAQRTNLLEQSLSKSNADLLKLKTDAAQLQKEYLDLIQVIPSLPQAGATGIVSPKFKQAFAKNPIKDINKDDNDATKQRLENIKQTISAYQTLAQAAASAFNTINEAQIASLDKEIAVRERRVTEATKLAERGNTEILRLEQNRLDEALKAREEAARRQQAINAALALSEAIVAIATAAGESGAGAIVIVPAVIAAIAAGYAAVSALTRDADGFKDGVVGYSGKGSGRSDSNIVKISNGESVITAEGTRKNRAVLEMINNGLVFTPNTQSVQGGNQQNYKSLEKKLDGVIEAIDGNKVSVKQSLDSHGLNQTVETIQRRERRKKL